MARTYGEKLDRLKNRRMDARDAVAMQMQESYEKRSQNSATRYALGAMQEVAPRSSEISIEEAEKVIRNLSDGLKRVHLSPTYKLQGSVPVNIHIRGASDVDLLVVEGKYLKAPDCLGGLKTYGAYDGRGTIAHDVLHLRNQSENVLEVKFYGADVDKTHPKSIALSGGGFRRKVDVVPSSWYDSADYQRTLNEVHRAVDILNKDTMELVRNYPFLFMFEINQKGIRTNDGSKMAIRLAKNIKNDSDFDIDLSSYDIASLIHHCSDERLFSHAARDLQILATLDEWFVALVNNRAFTYALDTPDKTRQIIQSDDVWNGLVRLQMEVSDLARSVERELLGPYAPQSESMDAVRKHLNDSSIPLMPETAY